MQDKSISLMYQKRVQSILNCYSILCSSFTLLPFLLLLSFSLVAFFKVFWIFILIIFLLITFFLPLLNEDFNNLLKNSFSGSTMNEVGNILISTYYLPLILTCISATFLVISIILTICNCKYTNSKNGLIGAVVMFIIALICCVIYYLCFDMFIGDQK